MTAKPLDCPPVESGYDSSSGLASASEVGSRRRAAEVSELAKVESLPLTPRGSLPLFSENPPPVLLDSAARLSLATAPEPSSISGALESLTWLSVN